MTAANGDVEVRAVFFASTPMIALEAAAHALAIRGRHRLVLIEDFEGAEAFVTLLHDWRDTPFETIERLPGRYTEHQRGSGDHPRGLAKAWRRVRIKRALREQTLARISALDREFLPQQVWVGNDRKVETQYALHLASTRYGQPVGRYLDDGLYTYLGDVRTRPLVRQVDWLVKQVTYGRWWHNAAQAGTSPWIAESWLAFPERARDQSDSRVRRSLSPALFATPAFVRLSIVAACALDLDRRALARARLVLVLPHSNQFALNAGLVDGLRSMIAQTAALGMQVALKYHPRERSADPGGLRRDGTTIDLPALLPMELLLPLLRPGTVLVGEGSTALMAASWLRPDLHVHDLGFSREGYAVAARKLFEELGMHSLDGDPAAMLAALADAQRSESG